MYLPDHHGSIGVFDSGIGGLSVANAVCGLLPHESLLYLADNAHAPYGARTDAEVLDYSRRITDFLLAAGVKLIVVACNTATSVAIDRLRTDYPEVPFVGLEPAVKPAGRGRRVGVLATAVTLRSARYRVLKARYLADRPVWESSCVGLVPLIENYGTGSAEVSAYLRELLAGQSPDTLVLGCTHYPLILDDIRAVVGSDVHLIDPSGAAARQVGRVLAERGLLAPSQATQPTVVDLVTTCGPAPLQRTLAQLPALNGRRRWVLPYLALNA